MSEARFMQPIVALLSLLLIGAGLPLEAWAGETKQGGCKALLGTYLTTNTPKGGDKIASRSLLSFAAAHLVLFTDSGESGEAGFAPFTDGQGTWYCEPGEGGAFKLSATLLDFTGPGVGSAAGIGRLDFALTSAPDSETLSGTATLYLIPLNGDPLDPAALKDGREFDITARRVGSR
jgi:hypothetical protein